MDSTDISAYFLDCPECDYEWRSHTPQRCPKCARSMGTTCMLESTQIDALMVAVNENKYGTNSEDKIMFILAELMNESWSEVPTAFLAQACWMYLRDQPSTPEIEEGMTFFEERFLESVDLLDA